MSKQRMMGIKQEQAGVEREPVKTSTLPVVRVFYRGVLHYDVPFREDLTPEEIIEAVTEHFKVRRRGWRWVLQPADCDASHVELAFTLHRRG